ncbi:class I SAM-dependent methyltransferase [Anaerosporobacter sp.]|uniref:class I SAM-dependent methyltransferase n=1 Tax=Anaerosporobacter sp. TaxID=1872529 RepID=UPI00286EDC83|nr:class I SAM-dependent methyltransferase [Anaerosporobacter sp.]
MENKEITAFDLLIESHLDLDRQGPGSSEMTLKALSFVENLDENSKVADIGCGTGGQTMVLAKKLDCHVTGIDMIIDFINTFNDKAIKQDLNNKVKGIVGDAFELPFEKEELDLIWSEGMIDSIGFEKALTYWNGFLKKGGYVVVTSPSWLKTERPDDLAKFWNDAGSGLYSVEDNIKAMQQSGYSFVSAFTLPEECWTQNYYVPRSAAENELPKKYPNNEMVKAYIKEMKYEVDLYEKYKEIYGYVFYIGKKCKLNRLDKG